MEKKSRNERITTTCIGPVTAPTRTLTCVTVPAIGATNVPACRFAADPTFIHVQVGKPLGNTVNPGVNAGGGPGSTVQSNDTFAGWLRFAPNGIAEAGDAKAAAPSAAAAAAALRSVAAWTRQTYPRWRA